MSVPGTKLELLDAIDTTFTKLQKDLDRVPVEQARDTTLEGHAKGTTMSPADLVAYLVGWNRQVLTWHRRRQEGLPDEFPAEGIKWNELGVLAGRYYREYESVTWDDLRSQLCEAKDGIVELISQYDDDELYGRPWYGKWTMGRMISFNTSSPYANARARIRKWLRTT
jgi:hypothetical protein